MLNKIYIKIPRKSAERLYDALFISEIFSYSIVDKEDFYNTISSDKNWDYVDNSIFFDDGFVEVTAIVESEVANEKRALLLAILKDLDVDISSLSISISQYDDYDWLKEWKKFYNPIEIGNFVIVPAWYKDYKSNKEIIYINPSIAFGTGEHESTKIALKLISNIKLKDQRVLDVGTGSGILGIAAKKSGASRVDFIDVDENALINTKENIELNSLIGDIYIYKSQFLSAVDSKFDVVISNMTADLNTLLLDELTKVVNNSLCVVLSGVLLPKADAIITLYNKSGFKLIDTCEIGEWVGMVFLFDKSF